jgi:hypothetical protein
MNMYMNSLETKFHDNTKIPIPLQAESYFHRHQPVNLKVVIEGDTKEYSATGKIYLTDKRLMFVAQEPCNDFETFHIMLSDVVSTIKSPPPRFRKKKVFSVRINSRNDDILLISLRYKSKHLGDKKIFEDYYSMLLRV